MNYKIETFLSFLKLLEFINVSLYTFYYLSLYKQILDEIHQVFNDSLDTDNKKTCLETKFKTKLKSK